MTALKKFAVLAVLAAIGAAAFVSGIGRNAIDAVQTGVAAAKPEKNGKSEPATTLAPAVSVAPVEVRDFVETVLVTGSLVPRDEILVSPEIEGLRVLDLNVDEGDRVKKGQVLATLVADTLDAQLAQSDAEIVRADAAIARATSQIAEAEARAREAARSLERAGPLKKQGWIAESTVDQREATARSSVALVAAAKDALKVAEAEKAQVAARRRELDWRRGNVEVKSPADGIISRRTARIGGMAVAAGEPMFRIIARGEIELDAEVTEAQVLKLKVDQPVVVVAGGGVEASGKVRLISPEINAATRLGKVRIFLGENTDLRIGAFASGTIETARSRGRSIPVSAIGYSDQGTTALAVIGDKVQQRTVTTGLTSGGHIEIKDGLNEGELVVARAGTFLRDGDIVRPVLPEAGRLSEAQ
jgi:RND family efflux transporter MFP subunit